jgi:hypothetical protein
MPREGLFSDPFASVTLQKLSERFVNFCESYLTSAPILIAI